MTNRLPRRAIAVALVAVFAALALFHVLVLVRVLPFDFIWGGQLESVADMRAYEAAALVLALAGMAVAAMNGGLVQPRGPAAALVVATGVLALLFSLVTMGNAFSASVVERAVFAPLTLVAAVGLWRLAGGARGAS